MRNTEESGILAVKEPELFLAPNGQKE